MTITRLDRAVGAVLGSAAGDALGAPYEFGPAGQLSARGEEMRGDTDTVAAVTGTLAGAVHGQAAVPDAWTGPLHVPLPGFDGRVLDAEALRALARRLAQAG